MYFTFAGCFTNNDDTVLYQSFIFRFFIDLCSKHAWDCGSRFNSHFDNLAVDDNRLAIDAPFSFVLQFNSDFQQNRAKVKEIF